LPSATLRKIRSRQIIGVEPLQLGSDNFQTMFSSVLQRYGKFVSPLNPLRFGPRHWGQLSAWANTVPSNRMTPVCAKRKLISLLQCQVAIGNPGTSFRLQCC
jgi:hypothetical protein